jgi:hypothetical protein
MLDPSRESTPAEDNDLEVFKDRTSRARSSARNPLLRVPGRTFSRTPDVFSGSLEAYGGEHPGNLCLFEGAIAPGFRASAQHVVFKWEGSNVQDIVRSRCSRSDFVFVARSNRGQSRECG